MFKSVCWFIFAYIYSAAPLEQYSLQKLALPSDVYGYKFHK